MSTRKNSNVKTRTYARKASSPNRTARGASTRTEHSLVGALVPTLCKGTWQAVAAAWRKLRNRIKFHRKTQKLCVCEMASLGEKRFVSVVQFENRRFLVGGAAGSISLLSELDPIGSRAGTSVRTPLQQQPTPGTASILACADMQDPQPFAAALSRMRVGEENRLAI